MEYVYAALLLNKLGKEITESSLKAVIEAAGGTADEAKIKTLVTSIKGVDINKAISEAAVVASAPAAGGAKQPEAKKEEKPKEEEAAEGLAALFG
jgi:large subunit ribosomal protein L12